MIGLNGQLFERRKDRRLTASIDAMILFMNGSCRMSCTILEISKSGATLRPADLAVLPNGFELLIASGMKVKCEAIHRSADTVGVRFISRIR
jgi:hypothetical protein